MDEETGLTNEQAEPVEAETKRVLRVGCPMWAQRSWIGQWYPQRTRPGTELNLYSKLCNAVEGNTTFYAEPSTETVARWLEQTPTDFRFMFKLPKEITHERRLNDVARPVRSFLTAMEPLGERLGPVQAQLPPGFGPEALPLLLNFVRRLPSDWKWALELRHPGWFDGSAAQQELDELLIERDISRIVLDTRPLYAVPAVSTAATEEKSNKPELPITLDAVGSRPIIRVIGEDSPQGTMKGLLKWVPKLKSWLGEGREPYLFVHQPENLDSPGLARALHTAISMQDPALDPLPEAPSVEDPEQTSMFE
ncbi:MAG: hypothetical protein ACI9BK_000358 [Acidimicrobiales bacterium]